MKLFAFVGAIAVAAGTTFASSDAGESGLVVLNESATGALTLRGNSRIEIPAKVVYVNSDAKFAVETFGTAVLDAPALHVVGGAKFTGQSHVTGTVVQSVAPFADPYWNTVFPSSANAHNYGGASVSGNATLSPGYYPQGITISGQAQVELSPGIYIVGGPGMSISSGHVSGSGVTIVMAEGPFSIAGNSTVNISPPQAGTLRGLVIAQHPSNTNEMHLAGGSGINIQGAIYAPKAKIMMVGNSSIEGEGPQMGDVVVADRVELRGTSVIRIGREENVAITLPTLPLFD